MSALFPSRGRSHGSEREIDLLGSVWRLLSGPPLLIAVATLTLLLLVAEQTLPQMPGQLATNAAAAARWLVETQEEFGALGSLLAGLGLFSVFQGYILRTLLTLLSLLLFVHLSDLIQTWFQIRTLKDRLHAPLEEPGLPLIFPFSRPLFRKREALPMPLDRAIPEVEGKLKERFSSGAAIEQTQGGYITRLDEAEERWLMVMHPNSLWLRPLLPAAAILSFALLWFGINFGWDVTPPPLAPTERYSAPQRSVELAYQIGSDGEPMLYVERNGEFSVHFPGFGSPLQLQNTTVDVREGAPAILLQSAERGDIMELPGESEPRAEVGLTFPTAGSEEVVLLPDSGAGLRIVRLAGEAAAFLVEVVVEDARVVDRIEVRADRDLVTMLPLDEEGEEEVRLQMRLLPSLEVKVRHFPGSALIWALLPLMLLGAIGVLRRPYFLLVQLGPWSPDRSVLIEQTTLPGLELWDGDEDPKEDKDES